MVNDGFDLTLPGIQSVMKKLHIVLLVCIAASIMVLLSFMGNLSTYETLATARRKPGKSVTVIAKLDRSVSHPIVYNPLKDPNLTTFYVVDTLGNRARVVYHFEKPMDMEKSDRIVLKGKMEGGVFDISQKDGILIKCPSKYKDDPKAQSNNLRENY